MNKCPRPCRSFCNGAQIMMNITMLLESLIEHLFVGPGKSRDKESSHFMPNIGYEK